MMRNVYVDLKVYFLLHGVCFESEGMGSRNRLGMAATLAFGEGVQRFRP